MNYFIRLNLRDCNISCSNIGGSATLLLFTVKKEDEDPVRTRTIIPIKNEMRERARNDTSL